MGELATTRFPKVEREFYDKIREVVPIACVDIIAVYGGKALLVKRKNIPAKGLWWVPGGGIRKWETPQMTVIRELKEETGLDASRIGFVTVMDSQFPEDNLHCVSLVFEARVSSAGVVLDDESSDYRWLELKDTGGRLELHHYLQRELAELDKQRRYLSAGLAQ